MSRIGIITFHSSHNFGSMLQAYAMQTFLEELGHEVKIIDHFSYEQIAQYPKLPIDYTLGTLRDVFFHPILIYQKFKGWFKFRCFKRENMKLTKRAMIMSLVKNVIEEEKFDFVISSGDQIWNVNCQDFSLAYLLPFEITAGKISYAPSLGGLVDWNPIDYASLIKTCLSSYLALSVREKTASIMLSDILRRKVDVMPDPTWLISNDNYVKVMAQPSKPIERGKYILYYSPASDHTISWAIEYAKIKKRKLVALSKADRPTRSVSYRLNVGPSEFLNYVKYADEIVGCSMHLLIFSVIFNKEFIILKYRYDSRLEDLVSDLGLGDRLVSIETPITSFVTPTSKVDDVSNLKRAEYRESARHFFDKYLV